MENNIFRIVLTGGPAGGKTTAMSHISDRLRSLGFNVFIVPEMATMMILGGIALVDSDPSKTMQIQSAMLEAQLHHEELFLRAAKITEKPSVILYDRGAMDSKAFIPPEMWQAILDEHQWTNIGLRDRHYEAVIHMVTAAIGAKEFYTLENNAARSESAEQAAAVDLLIRDAWVGHPHLRVIDNSTNFEEKIHRVIQAICNVVGVPQPVERERKFLVRGLEDFKEVKAEKVQIEQTYLRSKDPEIERIRKRGQNGSYTYTHTVKNHISSGKNIEKERMISSREYLNLLTKADPTRQPIKKDRHCFLWENQYFELDIFRTPESMSILEVELDNDAADVRIPPFIKIDREVTDDPKYSNANLALI